MSNRPCMSHTSCDGQSGHSVSSIQPTFATLHYIAQKPAVQAQRNLTMSRPPISLGGWLALSKTRMGSLPTFPAIRARISATMMTFPVTKRTCAATWWTSWSPSATRRIAWSTMVTKLQAIQSTTRSLSLVLTRMTLFRIRMETWTWQRLHVSTATLSFRTHVPSAPCVEAYVTDNCPLIPGSPGFSCRHSTFQLFGYHVLRPDWHENFTPAEKISQLGHTILNCDGIRSQLVAEWNDCPHTPNEEFTDAEAQALATVMVQDKAIPLTLQNLLNFITSNISRIKNRDNGNLFIDYDNKYMLNQSSIPG